MADGKKNRRGTGAASSPKRKSNASAGQRKSSRTACKAGAAKAGAAQAGPKTTGEEDRPLPPPSEPTKEVKKTKKTRITYTDDDRSSKLAKYRELCDGPATTNLYVLAKSQLLGVAPSTLARWDQSCIICYGNFPVIKGTLSRCPNCDYFLCIKCVSRLLTTNIAEASISEYLDTHTVKCPSCMHTNAFRPAGGPHGKQSKDIASSIFNPHLLRIIESNVE